MLNQQEYNELLPYRTHLKNVADGGSPPNLPLPRFNDIRKQHIPSWNNKDVDWYCNGCKMQLIIDMWCLMEQYEETNPQ